MNHTARYPMLVWSLVVALPWAPARGQTLPARSATAAERYLRTVGLGDQQLRAADDGQVVVKLLKTEDNRDVAIAGVVAVRASREAIVARAIEKRGLVAVEASRSGVFGDPPSAADVAGVAFDRSEYKGLRTCHPADCDFKLSASQMTTFGTDVDWSSPDAKAQADARLRTELLRLVTDYESRGNAALPTYDDGPGVRAADAFDAVLAQSAPILSEYAPQLQRYLASYPSGRPASAREFMYWLEQRLPRMRPTLMVDHVVIDAPPNEPAFIARKQIFATHYTEAALELLAVIDADTSASAPTTYLVTVRRFRFDYLPGGIVNVRGRVRNHLMGATRDDLMGERAAIERTGSASGR